MTAHNEKFPWESYYKNYDFFEERMLNHHQVISCEEISPGNYKIKRKNGKELRIFICECYSYGVSEYLETINEIGPIDAVIINSQWCGYTPDVKFHCRDQMVGIFRIGEFMGALRKSDFWNYLTEEQEHYYRESGWL